MAKTKIEWVKNPDGSQGYTINPVKGKCPMGCHYCYAGRLYDRFKWNPEIAYMPPHELGQLLNSIKKPSRIFMGSTMELFGPWVDPMYREFLLAAVSNYPQHTFLFLTKMPENLLREWPDNCWVGATATDYRKATDACGWLDNIQATVKFVSIEPLLSWNEAINTSAATNWFSDLDWLIIGQQTPVSKKTEPKASWIAEIVEAADKAGVPVFLKDNLLPLLKVQGFNENIFWRDEGIKAGFEPLHLLLRQELPEGAAIPERMD